jgi:hypothetical protein
LWDGVFLWLYLDLDFEIKMGGTVFAREGILDFVVCLILLSRLRLVKMSNSLTSPIKIYRKPNVLALCVLTHKVVVKNNKSKHLADYCFFEILVTRSSEAIMPSYVAT